MTMVSTLAGIDAGWLHHFVLGDQARCRRNLGAGARVEQHELALGS